MVAVGHADVDKNSGVNALSRQDRTVAPVEMYELFT